MKDINKEFDELLSEDFRFKFKNDYEWKEHAKAFIAKSIERAILDCVPGKNKKLGIMEDVSFYTSKGHNSCREQMLQNARDKKYI